MTRKLLQDILRAAATADDRVPHGVRTYWSEYFYTTPMPRYITVTLTLTLTLTRTRTRTQTLTRTQTRPRT